MSDKPNTKVELKETMVFYRNNKVEAIKRYSLSDWDVSLSTDMVMPCLLETPISKVEVKKAVRTYDDWRNDLHNWYFSDNICNRDLINKLAKDIEDIDDPKANEMAKIFAYRKIFD